MTLDMTKDAALLAAVAQEVRGKTLKLLDSVEERELLWTPPSVSNHILWHAGHSYWVQEVLCVEAITGAADIPAGWVEMFSNTCCPPRDRKVWPQREEVRPHLERQLPRIVAAINSLTRKALEEPACAARLSKDKPLWYWIAHGLQDEANHQGQMHLLHLMQRT